VQTFVADQTEAERVDHDEGDERVLGNVEQNTYGQGAIKSE
jgi:hypothetical protein